MADLEDSVGAAVGGKVINIGVNAIIDLIKQKDPELTDPEAADFVEYIKGLAEDGRSITPTDVDEYLDQWKKDPESSYYKNNAQEEVDAEQDELDTAIEDLQNFDETYGAFEYDPESVVMKAQARSGNEVLEQFAAMAARANAQSGVTSGGNINRNLARLAQGQGQAKQQLTSQEYLRQYGDYLTNKGVKFGQEFGLLQFENSVNQQNYQNAMDSYYKGLAIQQEKAALQYQQEQDKNNQFWDTLLNVGKLGMQVLPFIL